MLSDALLERAVCLLLKHSEGGQFGRRPVLLVEGGEIEALVVGEGFVRDDLQSKLSIFLKLDAHATHLGCQEKVLLLAFPLLCLNRQALLI